MVPRHTLQPEPTMNRLSLAASALVAFLIVLPFVADMVA